MSFAFHICDVGSVACDVCWCSVTSCFSNYTNCQTTKNCANCQPPKLCQQTIIWQLRSFDTKCKHFNLFFSLLMTSKVAPCEKLVLWNSDKKPEHISTSCRKVPCRAPWMYIVYKVNISWFSLTDSGRKCAGAAIDIHLRRHGPRLLIYFILGSDGGWVLKYTLYQCWHWLGRALRPYLASHCCH